MSKRTVIILLTIITLLALALRLHGLGRQSLSYDESIEEMNFYLFQGAIKGGGDLPDVTPPLNSFFLYFVNSAFPRNDFATRTVPLTFGVLSIPLFFILVKKIFNEKIALIASYLLATSPFHIWYSQDARMYALLWMLALISLIFFLRVIEEPSLKNYILYIIATVADLYTHQYAIFVILLQYVFLLLYRKHFNIIIIRWLLAFIVIGLLYSPWLIYSMTTLVHLAKAGFAKAIDIKAIFYTLYAYCAGFSIGPSLRELHLNTSLSVIKPYLSEIISLTGLYLAVFLFGLWSLVKEGPKLVLVLLIVIIPIAGAFMITKIMPDLPYNVRYTGVALFGVLMILSYSINSMLRLKSKTYGALLMILSLIAITGFDAYSYINYNFNKKYQKVDIRGTVAYIRENRKEGDIQLCAGNPGGIFGKYSNRKFFCESLPVIKNEKNLLAFLNTKLRGKKRVWLIVIHDWPEDVRKTLNLTKAWFDSNFKEIKGLHKDESELANIRIYCYDLTKK